MRCGRWSPVYGENQKTFLLSPQDRWDSGSLAGPSSLAGTPTSARFFSRSPILPLFAPPHHPLPPPFQGFVRCNPYRLTHQFTLPRAPSTLHAISLPREVDLNLQPHRSPSPNTSGSQTLACIRTIWRACDTQITRGPPVSDSAGLGWGLGVQSANKVRLLLWVYSIHLALIRYFLVLAPSLSVYILPSR